MKQPYQIETVIESMHDGMLLRDYLLRVLRLSRRALTAIKFREGLMKVNDEQKTVRYQLKTGDRVMIVFPPEETSPSLKAQDMPLDILYEDAHVVVINKTHGLPVIPSQKYPTGTLANGVLAHLDQQNLAYTVHTVTRLDRDTSGLLLIAKHRHAHDFFVKMQKEHQIHRRYLAIVQGMMSGGEGTIDAPIARKEGSIIERTVASEGKSARTHYRVVKRLKNDLTVVAIELETGRTHQIRVHFAHIGHPLAGDDLYGGSLAFINRQALHSFELSFKHPFSKEDLLFRVDCPDDMKAVMGVVNVQSF